MGGPSALQLNCNLTLQQQPPASNAACTQPVRKSLHLVYVLKSKRRVPHLRRPRGLSTGCSSITPSATLQSMPALSQHASIIEAAVKSNVVTAPSKCACNGPPSPTCLLQPVQATCMCKPKADSFVAHRPRSPGSLCIWLASTLLRLCRSCSCFLPAARGGSGVRAGRRERQAAEWRQPQAVADSAQGRLACIK